MFTGLVETRGEIRGVRDEGVERDLEVDLAGLDRTVRIGDSVALSGVCCTVVELREPGPVASFRLSEETLRRTWLGSARPGDLVNLEAALRVGDPMGGHVVQGHVDGVGKVVRPIDAAAGGTLEVEIPRTLVRYTVEKGSIAIDGVSLTIAGRRGARLAFAIVPHTARVTTLGRARPGDPVHVEVDVLAKYVESLLGGYRPPHS